jgi:hypothetical protein
MSVPCELGRNMLGCAEIIGRNPVLRSVAAEEADKLKC